MPELPEVEVTRMGLAPFVEGKVLRKAVIRVKRLRSPVGELAQKLDAKTVLQLSRRGKYLVWHFVDAQGVKGWLVTHLGMSGYWRVWQLPAPEPGVHEHVDFVFDDCLVRLTDVRRFGDMCWFDDDPFGQKPLADLGWESFDANVTAEMFARAMRAKRRPVKEVLMAGDVVVGCGNIYSSESLFLAGIHPARTASRISEKRLSALFGAIQSVLSQAIDAGGSTLRDFHGVDGVDGYFALRTNVYGREGELCRKCGSPIKRIVQAGRSTFYCPKCQK